MKFILLLFVAFYTPPSQIWAQYQIPQEWITRTLLVEFAKGSGSGFFFSDTIGTYFITARHVILNEVKDEKGNTIDYQFVGNTGQIISYPRNIEKGKPDTLLIDFLGLYNSGNLRFRKDKDILVARIGHIVKVPFEGTEYIEPYVLKKNQKIPSRINPYSFDEAAPLDSVITGNDVFIFGYPKSLGLVKSNQYNFNRPLLRKGSVAARNFENKTVIIDCPSFGGNSGGPVVMMKGSIFNLKYHLIGLVVAFIPFVETWENKNFHYTNDQVSNSGYSIVEPMDEILKLIKDFK